jgi:hypothetical protein
VVQVTGAGVQGGEQTNLYSQTRSSQAITRHCDRPTSARGSGGVAQDLERGTRQGKWFVAQCVDGLDDQHGSGSTICA